MTFFEAIISGIVQGVAEFLPISSSGHLVILHRLTGLKEPQIFFDIFLHVGTLTAIFIVFWRDILEAFTVKKKIGFFILIATAATACWVLIFGKLIEQAFAHVKMVGIMLIVTGCWLMVGSFVRFGSEGMTRFKAVIIGLAQGVAALPGISRSGATISTAMFLGASPQAAARFSFLLSIPAVIAAFLFKIRHGALAEFNVNYIFGFIFSCITGIWSLKLLLRVLYKNRLYIFAVYCILLGIVTAVFL